jgi:cytochrome c-type biogenesis protein CcmH/NrfG
MNDKVVTLHTLMAGVSAENAFPGKDYEAVRVAYARMRSAEQGNALSADEIAAAKKRRADAEAIKVAKLKEQQNTDRLRSIGMVVVVAVIVVCLGGFLLSPLWMFFRRKKLAADELRAPYVYIKKHAKYPVAHKDMPHTGNN